MNRALPAHLDAVVYRGGDEGPAWDIPPIITYMVNAASLTPDEAYKTFNMGVGMSVVCAPDEVDDVRRKLADEGLQTFEMGKIVAGSGCVVYE